MEELSADNILAQVDCQNLAVSVGQQTVAASIQVPSSSHIFAVGNYTVPVSYTHLPIVQDGCLVGAVTHVLVNDPTRGYGIFAATMLKRADAVQGR